ncbi:Unknown protein, partial [Striga hermonthica]
KARGLGLCPHYGQLLRLVRASVLPSLGSGINHSLALVLRPLWSLGRTERAFALSLWVPPAVGGPWLRGAMTLRKRGPWLIATNVAISRNVTHVAAQIAERGDLLIDHPLNKGLGALFNLDLMDELRSEIYLDTESRHANPRLKGRVGVNTNRLPNTLS